MDAETFKKEFLPYHEKLYRIAFRILQNESNAEDLVQDTFIKLWNKRDELDSIEKPESYAVIVLRNLCMDMLRQSKEKSHIQYDFDIPEKESLVSQVEVHDKIDHLTKLMKKLPVQQQQIMALNCDGYSYEEIEEITGLNIANIRVIISRARKTLREQYSKIEQK